MTQRPLLTAGYVLGFGLGGFFDGIVLHQLLQWHHLVSGIVPDDTLAGLELNTLWDGIFHMAMYAITAIGLVLLTLLPLGLRAAGIVMVAVPLSMAIGMAALHALGYSLNQITIAGFVLSLGLLVDDSIVVVENIARHLRMGHSRTEAAILGTKQILEALLGCTAALVLAFLPLAAAGTSDPVPVRRRPGAAARC